MGNTGNFYAQLIQGIQHAIVKHHHVLWIFLHFGFAKLMFNNNLLIGLCCPRIGL
ncbi:hypothetical protein D3C76_1840920 [compost metagenome]